MAKIQKKISKKLPKTSEKKLALMDVASIKKKIEAQLKAGKIKPRQAEILKQREPLKQRIDHFSDDPPHKKPTKKTKPIDKNKWIHTGIVGFDELLQKGIQKGSSILVCGGPGSGKTIFCLQTLA